MRTSSLAVSAFQESKLISESRGFWVTHATRAGLVSEWHVLAVVVDAKLPKCFVHKLRGREWRPKPLDNQEHSGADGISGLHGPAVVDTHEHAQPSLVTANTHEKGG